MCPSTLSMELVPRWIRQSHQLQEKETISGYWTVCRLVDKTREQATALHFRDPKPCLRTHFMRKSPKLLALNTNQILWFLCCHFYVRNLILLQTQQQLVSVASLHQELSLEGSESQICVTFSSVQSLNHVQLFVTAGIIAHQASQFITNSRS